MIPLEPLDGLPVCPQCNMRPLEMNGGYLRPTCGKCRRLNGRRRVRRPRKSGGSMPGQAATPRQTTPPGGLKHAVSPSIVDAAGGIAPSGASIEQLVEMLSGDPDTALELRRTTDVKTRAVLAYLADHAGLAAEALVIKAADGGIMHIKLLFEILGVKPMRYKAPAKIDDEMLAVPTDGTGEEYDNILRDTKAANDAVRAGSEGTGDHPASEE